MRQRFRPLGEKGARDLNHAFYYFKDSAVADHFMKVDIDISESAELTTETGDRDVRKLTCRVVDAQLEFVGKQTLLCAPGISAESVGAQRIHLQIVTIAPGQRAKAHKHEGHETAIYILSGESGLRYGERLEEHLYAQAGSFVYIPAGMPHLPYNPSATESCVAIIARTDPNEQESVVLMPELDSLRP